MPSAKMDLIARELSGVQEVVIDVSLAFDAILGTPTRLQLARRFFTACNETQIRLVVPPMFSGEVDTAARQALHRSGLPADDLPAIYSTLDALPVTMELQIEALNAVRLRARRIAELLQQPSVYDATYAALAEWRGCHFWTADKTFANASKQTRRQPDNTTVVTLPVVRYNGDYGIK